MEGVTHLYQARYPHTPKFPKVSMVTPSGSKCQVRAFMDYYQELKRKADNQYILPPDLYRNPDKFYYHHAMLSAFPVSFFGDGRIMKGLDNQWTQWFDTRNPEFKNLTPATPNTLMERYLIQLMVYATKSPEICWLNSKVGKIELRFKIGKRMLPYDFQEKVNIYPLTSTEEKNEIVFAYCREQAKLFLHHWERFLNPKSTEFVKNFFMFHTKFPPFDTVHRIAPFTPEQHNKINQMIANGDFDHLCKPALKPRITQNERKIS